MQEVWVLTRKRTHKGAYDGPPQSGATINSYLLNSSMPILTPEPCNLDQATNIRYVTAHAREVLPPLCRRCFKL
jgi:hypothetical protein